MFISFESYCIDFIHVQVIQCTMIKCHIRMLESMLNFNHFFDSFLENFPLHLAITCTTSICKIPQLVSNWTDCTREYYGILINTIDSAGNLNQNKRSTYVIHFLNKSINMILWKQLAVSFNYSLSYNLSIIQILLKPSQYLRLRK